MLLLLVVPLLFCRALSAQHHHHIYPVLDQTVSLSSRIRFDRTSVEEGLSNSFVQCIIQDKRGFMWFGTQEGLNKFDGYKFTLYEYDEFDSSSISDNSVRAICEDRSGNLWIGTNGGLNKFDPAMEKFSRFHHDPSHENTVASNTILSIVEDKKGILWIGTNAGLDKYDERNNTFTHFRHDPQNPMSLSHNYAGVLYIDHFGVLWIGTGFFNLGRGGLNRFDMETNTFSHFVSDPTNESSINDNWVTAIAEDNSGTLWVGTDRGLEEFNRRSNTFTHYYFRVGASWNSVRRNSVKAVRVDRSGAIWIGTWQDGLFKFNKSMGRFSRYTNNSSDNKSISNNFPQCIYEDRAGLFWIGTIGAGINKYQPVPSSFTHFKFEDPNHVGPAINDVRSFYSDGSGGLWVGTMWGMYIINLNTGNVTPAFVGDQYINAICEGKGGVLWLGTGNGMFNFDRQKRRPIHFYQVDCSTPDTSGGTINALLMSSDKKLWIGAMTFLAEMDPTSGKLKYYIHDSGRSKSLSNNHIHSILQDKSGTLWIGTANGLNRFVPETGSFLRYRHDPQDAHSLSNDDIRILFEDHSGVLWIGTSDGLHKYDRESTTFSNVTKNSGIRNKVINGILEDSHRNLWISTNKGLAKFNPVQKTVRNYDVTDGLQGDEFNLGASFRDESGEMFLGGVNGLTAFHPDSIHDNLNIPPVVITNFRLFNEEVPIGEDSPLHESVSGAKVIYLRHDQNSVSFEFASLDYAAPSKNQYAYKFEGIDKDWVHSGSRRFINYANLSPGEYLFRVKASNNDGIWNEQGTTLSIVVLAPWYQRWWAYGLYTIVFLGMVMSIYRVRINRLKLEHRVLVEHLQAEKLSEMNSMKSRFLANVSHELRTPLTTIIGPVDQLSAIHADSQTQEHLGMIKRNAHRLLRMIDLLLQFSKAESGALKLAVQKTSVISHLRRITSYFTSAAAKKEIQIQFAAPEGTIEGYLDVEKIEHIVQNIISNAIKFTSSGGVISVDVSVVRDELIISVRDTGEGISQEHLPHIFDRFYRVDATHKQEGIGIGLSLTKELVEIHHGSISSQSTVGVGTTFVVKIPLVGYADNEIRSHPIEERQTTDDGRIPSALVPTSPRPPIDHDKTIILIAEDNDDTRSLIVSQLSRDYSVVEAVDGRDARSKAQFQIPDLVISDVMMPDMDGYELCRSLKQDERTSHIPIILLTALADRDDKIEGLQTGADDYLIKPFDAKELSVRIKNLIENRKKMREAFSRSSVFPQLSPPGSSVDQQFINKAIATVHKHLSNESYDTDQFSKEMFLSRAQLHRKLRAVSDLSATEFIRRTRLHYAKELLEKKAGTIAEIADKVGFSNHSYFARCFKEQFGVLPSEIDHI